MADFSYSAATRLVRIMVAVSGLISQISSPRTQCARTCVIPRRKSEIDIVEKKSAVTIRPKPAFRPIVEVATTCEGSGISLINQTPQTQESQGNDSHGDSCNLEPQGMKT